MINTKELENKTIYAVWTDRTDFLCDVGALCEDKLLELRAFDESGEYRAYRSTVDDPFHERNTADIDYDFKFQKEYFLDIDTKNSGNGEVKKTIGGGSFCLPKGFSGATKIVVEYFCKYDDDGVASSFDWRIAGLK